MIVTLIGILQDGSTPVAGIAPLAPYQQQLAIPQFEDTTVNLVVKGVNGAPIDITAGTLRLTGRPDYINPNNAFISHPADVIDNGPGGLAHFNLTSSETGAGAIGHSWHDIAWQDGTGKWRQIVPASDLYILPPIGTPTTPLVPPLTTSGLGFYYEGATQFTSGGINAVTVALPGAMPMAAYGYKVFWGIQSTDAGALPSVVYQVIDALHFALIVSPFNGWVIWGTRP